MIQIEIRRIARLHRRIGKTGMLVCSSEARNAQCLANRGFDTARRKVVGACAAFGVIPVNGNAETAVLLSFYRFQLAEPNGHAQTFVVTHACLCLIGSEITRDFNRAFRALGQLCCELCQVHESLPVWMRQQF